MKNKLNFLEFFQSLKSTLLVTILLFTCVSVWGTDFTLSSADEVSKDGITVTFGNARTGTAPAWYSAGLRLYASNTVTISSTSAITAITFNWEKQGSKPFASVSASTGNYSHPSEAGEGTWTGSATSIVFTLGTSGQLQLNTLSVTAGVATYKLSYANGGGSGDGPTEVKNLKKDDKIELASNTFTAPAGKKFDGWNDGTNTYNAGAQYTMPASNVTMTAQWSAITYTDYITQCATTYDVKFYTDNGETQYGETKKVVENGFAIAPATNPTKDGYSFSGWSETFGGDVVTVSSITITADKNFYAKWACATPTIKTDLSTAVVEYNQNDVAIALTVAANETYDLDYQWQSKVGEGDWNNISGANEASYTPSTLNVGTTYYRCVISNGVDDCSTNVTSSVATITVNAVSCSNYMFHYGTNGQPADTWETICFFGADEDRTIANFVMPDQPNYYVDWAGTWQNDYSVMAKFAEDLKFTKSLKNNESTGTATGASVGAIGTLHVTNSWGCCNKRVSFDPDGYKFVYGLEGQTWSSLNLTANNTVWMSDDVVLTADMLNGNIKYYVGINANNADGYVFTSNSNTVGMNTMGVYVNGAWIENAKIGELYAAGDKGKLRMWSDNFDAKNWQCHFVPYWTLKFDANGKEGVTVPETIEKFSELEESQRTIGVSTLVPTNIPEHFTFAGWYTQAEGGTKIEKDYVMNSHATLYAHWTEDTKYTVKWYVNGVETKSEDYYVNTAYSTVKTDAPAVADGAMETCANKFMGWATASISSQTGVEEDDVNWVDEESTITAATNYYAVFATESDGGTPKFLKYEAVTTAPADWSGTYVMVDDDDYIVERDGGKTTQMIGVSGFLTTTEFVDDEIVIAKTTNGYSMFFKNGSYYLGLNSDDAKLHLNTSYSSSSCDWILGVDKITSYAYQSRYIRMNGTKVACYGTSGDYTYLKLYKRVETSSKSYSNYLTTCRKIDNIEVASAPTKTTYNEDETLDLTGLSIQVNYEEGDPAVITEGFTTSPENGATLTNETQVTITYKGHQCTQDITVTQKARNTISATTPVGGTYTVKVGDAEAQTITAAKAFENVKVGSTIVMTTSAGDDYVVHSTPFVVKDADNATVSVSKSGDNYTFTMPDKAVTITAQYVQSYTVTPATGLIGGSVSVDKTKASKNTKITVTVSPNTGYSITKVYYVKEGEETENTITLDDNKYSFSMPQSNVTVYATFAQKTYTIKLSDRGNVTTATSTIHYGETFSDFPTIQTCTGYEAFGWTDEAPTSEAWASAPAKVVSYTVQDVAVKVFYAAYRQQTGESAPTNNYRLIDKLSDLESGAKYVLCHKETAQSMMSNEFDSYDYIFPATQATINNNVISSPADKYIWTISGNNKDGYSFKGYDNKYILDWDGTASWLDYGTSTPALFTFEYPNASGADKAKVNIKYNEAKYFAGAKVSYSVQYNFRTTEGDNRLYKQVVEPQYSYLTTPTCKVLDHIAVTKAPNKVNYKAGESFDKTGMEATAYFTIGDPEVVQAANLTINGGENLTMETTSVTVQYEYDGVQKETSYNINMIELKSIAVNSGSTHKTKFKIGQTFNPANLKLDAHYNTTGSTLAQDVVEIVTSGFTYSPTTALAEGTQEITITYGGKVVKFNVTVEQASPAKVTFKASSTSTYVETETSAGAGVKVPSVNDCEDYTFLGWTADDMSSELTEQPTLITITEGRYYPEEDVILYPVYKGFNSDYSYTRATSLDELTNGARVVIYNESGKKTVAYKNGFYGGTLPTETDNTIYCYNSEMVWSVSGSASSCQFKNGSVTMGIATLPTSNSAAISNSTANANWKVTMNGTNFLLGLPYSDPTSYAYLEYHQNNWVGYKITGTPTANQYGYINTRIYVSNADVIYTSAPSTCTVAIEKSDVILNAGTGSVTPDAFEVLKNESITLPDATFSCAGGTDWSFYGWATESVYPATATAPAKVNKTYTPTEDVELFAVYQKSGKYISTPSCLQVPSFSHEAGEYDEKVTLTLTAGDNSAIYYTTDGSCPIDAKGDPTDKAIEYTSAIELTSDATIAAIAVYTAGQSDMVSAAYTFVYPDAPEYSVAAGNIEVNKTVTISSAEGTNVMYKIGDAEYVTAETNSYTYTFASLGAVTIKAKATKGGLESDEVSRDYTVVAKPYTVTFNAGAGLIDGESTKEITETAQGHGVKLPVPTDPCSDDTWEFYGWSETNQTEDVTTAPTLVESSDYGSYKKYYPEADITLYAIFVKKQGGTMLLEESCKDLTVGEGKNFVSSTGTVMTTDASAAGGVRLGTKKASGAITSKVINVPVGSTLTFTFDYKAWADQDYADITITELNGASTTYTGANHTSYALAQSVSLTTTKENPQFTFATANNKTYRSFLRNIVISMGEVTAHYQNSPVCCVNSVSYNVGDGVAIDPVKIPCNTGKFITLPKAEKQNCEFIKWTLDSEEYEAGDVYQYAATQSGDVEFTAVFSEPVTEVTITKEMGAVKASEVLPLGYTGKLIVKDGAVITMDQEYSIGDFIIESKQGSSGQVKGGMNLTIKGNAYMEMEIDAADEASFGWYAITVPFPVSGSAGIYYGDKKLQAEKDYSVMKYLGDVRAQGKYGWKKCQSETLQPGVFYLLAVADTDYKTLRFYLKKDGASYTIESQTTTPAGKQTSFETKVYEFASSVSTDAGWNGVGNKSLEYASVNSNGVIGDEVQIYNHDANAFSTVSVSDYTFSVGKPFFVQANDDDDFTCGPAVHSTILAPARTAANTSEKIKVTLSDNAYTDNLFISASEEALPQYEITRDLAKMAATGTVSVPQIATKNYGVDLCVEYAPLTNDQATYALSLFAPVSGEYTIAATQVEGCELFLTKNGEVIWNLSMSDYAAELAKGNNAGYGLVLKKKPNTPTDINNVRSNEDGIQKFIYDEKLIIIRGGCIYNAAGALVK